MDIKKRVREMMSDPIKFPGCTAFAPALRERRKACWQRQCQRHQNLVMTAEICYDGINTTLIKP